LKYSRNTIDYCFGALYPSVKRAVIFDGFFNLWKS